MFKRFLIALLKLLLGLALCGALVLCPAYYIYSQFYIDPQTLMEEYEEIADGDSATDKDNPETTPLPSPTPAPIPDWPAHIDITSWEYILANTGNNIDNYEPPATEYFDGCLMDTRIVEAAREMVIAARDADCNIYLSTGYQKLQFVQSDYDKAVAAGKDLPTAEVAAPGTNEHQTGLCIDILANSAGSKDLSFDKTPVSWWLKEHCAEYGFILRYPEDKEAITGVAYSPWHFRYVGKTAAEYIMDKGLCLEEFLALYGVQNTSAQQ